MTPNAEEGAIMAERFPLIIHSAQEFWNGRRRQSERGVVAEEGIGERQ
jgi:hypothetical protein